MHTKISVVGVEARDKVIRGADYVADAVRATLGPFGLNALLEKGNRPTNDGYTISAELAPTLEDEFERRGALALHEASSKTNDEVGDATSSVQALTQAIIKETVRLLPNEKSLTSKNKPSEVLRMIEESKKNVIEKLKESKKLIASKEELVASAKVSVEDDELAKMIGETQWEIGAHGVILVEEVLDSKSSIQVIKGIRIDSGFGTPVVMTNQEEQSLEVNDTAVILTNYSLGQEDIIAMKEKVFMPLLNQKKSQITLIARAFTPDAIKLIMESHKAGLLIYPINAPYVYQTEIMKDLAAITGANYYDTEESRLEDLSIVDVGFASKILARRFDAIITGMYDPTGKYLNSAVEKRVDQLKQRLSGNALSDFDKKLVEARIAQFEGGFAILKIGAETVFERKFKKDKADDAVNSVRLALQEGTVKGAGLAFKEISEQLDDSDILKRPLMCIFNQIMSSAPEGFVIEDWVRDPYLTLVSALTNACSVAGQFGTINVVITTKDKKEKNEE